MLSKNTARPGIEEKPKRNEKIYTRQNGKGEKNYEKK